MSENRLSAINHRYRGWRESTKLIDTARATSADLCKLEQALGSFVIDYRQVLAYVDVGLSLGGTYSSMMNTIQQVTYRLNQNNQ